MSRKCEEALRKVIRTMFRSYLFVVVPLQDQLLVEGKREERMESTTLSGIDQTLRHTEL